LANEQRDPVQSYNEIDNLRIEIAVLQEPIKSFIPGFAKFKIPPLMTDKNNINSTQTSDDVYIELYVPYEYTFCWGSDVVAEGTRFLVASVGGNLNDMRIIGRYDYNASIPNPAECLAHYIIEIIMLNKREQAILKSCYKNDKNIYCHHHGRPHLENILDIVPNPYTKSGGLGGLGGIASNVGGGSIGGAISSATGSIGSSIGGIGSAIGSVTNSIGNSIGGISNAIGSTLGSVGSGLGNALGNNLNSAISNSIGGLTQGISDTLGNITNSLSNINNSLSGLSKFANNVTNNLGSLSNGLSGLSNITNITNASELSNLTKSISSGNLSNITSNITDMVSGATGNVLNTVANTISGVFNTSTLLSKSVKAISPDYNYFQQPSTDGDNKTKALESFIANTNSYGYLTKQGGRTITEKITSAIMNK